jgi:peptide subunit release factor 1 (eRF1)
MPHTDQLAAQLDRISAWDPGPFPVVSLYLNLQPNERGREQFDTFLRKEFADRVATYAAEGPERASLDRDVEKIRSYVDGVDRAAQGLAVFSCSGGDLFEAIPLAAPVAEHRLSISTEPNLYPLALLADEYPRYAAVVANTNVARIFVFAGNAQQHAEHITGTKTKHHKVGGWSQARYQRHTKNYHLHHAKEVIDTLGRIVRDEGIQSIVLAGDEVIVPLLKDQLPKDLAERVVDVVKLDIRAGDRDVLDTTLAAMREVDAKTDREQVDALLGAYRGNGLACVGPEQTRKAFELGQVDELVISAAADEREANEFVLKARQTSADIRFIEDGTLLAQVGGVGAFLRFKI